MKTTGLSSRIAVFRRPFASAGVEGRTTFKPGTCATQAWRLWLCWAAERRVAPIVVSSVRGAVTFSTLGEDIFGHLARVGERRLQREREPRLDLGARLVLDALQVVGRREVLLFEPRAEEGERVALAAPELLLLLRPVVRTVDVADVMPVVAVRVAEQKGGAASRACALHELRCRRVDRAHILSVDLARFDSEGPRTREDVARRHVEVVRVLVVLVVLADVDHGQLPERGHVHHLVDEPLAERALAEEAHGDLVRAPALRGERCARRDPGRAADDCIRAEIAVLVIGDVHRAALAAAVAGFLPEQLGEHAPDLRALGEAVT